MGDERESAEIVNALIGLGLGLAITGEGIEQNAQGRGLLAQPRAGAGTSV